MTEGFEATHRLKGSGYELRYVAKGTTSLDQYTDAHGNCLKLFPDAVEKVTLPEPDDGTLWRLESTGDVYYYCNANEKFVPLKCSGIQLQKEQYTEKAKTFTRLYLYE